MTRMDTGRTNQTIDQDRRRLLGAATMGMAVAGAAILLPSQLAAAPPGDDIRPFHVNVPEADLTELRRRTVFGQMEAGLGLLPGAGGVQHLTRLVGRQRAMEVVLSGDDYGAELAAQYGWINRAIADATLDTFVGDLARRIAKFPASGLRAIKTSIANISLPDEHAIRADGAKFLELMNTEEAKSRRAARDERYREDARAEWEMNYGRIIGEL
ncbi:MAG: enoyl-CoA hydratase-related protein [Methylocella sp.]